MRVHLILTIETGDTMNGREFEALRDDLRAFARQHVVASGGTLIEAKERAAQRPKKPRSVKKPAPKEKRR